MNETIYSYWPSLWAFGIFGLKTILDLSVFRQGFSSDITKIKLKGLGTDLFWIGVMAWGAILIQDNNIQLVKFFGTSSHIRLLAVLALSIVAIIITLIKRVEEGISANNATGIMRMGQNLLVCILVFFMIMISLSNFSVVFFLMGLSQQ